MSQVVNNNNLTIQQTQKTTCDARVVRTRLTDKRAHTIIFSIPRPLALQYHLDKPTHMIMIPRDDGILIRKLQMENE